MQLPPLWRLGTEKTQAGMYEVLGNGDKRGKCLRGRWVKKTKKMETRGIEPRTTPMLREYYTTKPHPQLDKKGLHNVLYERKLV